MGFPCIIPGVIPARRPLAISLTPLALAVTLSAVALTAPPAAAAGEQEWQLAGRDRRGDGQRRRADGLGLRRRPRPRVRPDRCLGAACVARDVLSRRRATNAMDTRPAGKIAAAAALDGPHLHVRRPPAGAVRRPPAGRAPARRRGGHAPDAVRHGAGPRRRLLRHAALDRRRLLPVPVRARRPAVRPVEPRERVPLAFSATLRVSRISFERRGAPAPPRFLRWARKTSADGRALEAVGLAELVHQEAPVGEADVGGVVRADEEGRRADARPGWRSRDGRGGRRGRRAAAGGRRSPRTAC